MNKLFSLLGLLFLVASCNQSLEEAESKKIIDYDILVKDYNEAHPRSTHKAAVILGELSVENAVLENENVVSFYLSNTSTRQFRKFEFHYDLNSTSLVFPSSLNIAKVIYLHRTLILDWGDGQNVLAVSVEEDFQLIPDLKPLLVNGIRSIIFDSKTQLTKSIGSECRCSCSACWPNCSTNCGSASASCSCGGNSQSMDCRDCYNASCTDCSYQ